MRWASTNVEALTSSLDIVQRKKMGLGTDEERSDCIREREGEKTAPWIYWGAKNLP